MSYLRSLKQLRENMLSQATNAQAPVETPSLIRNSFVDNQSQVASTEDLLSDSAAWLSKIKSSSSASQANRPKPQGNFATGLVESLSSAVDESFDKRQEVKEEKKKEAASIFPEDSIIARKSSGGETTKPVPLDGPVRSALNAIAAVESRGSGDYAAVGPVVKKGMYANQRAYGRYQVMEGNIAPWTKAAIGRSLTKEEFLASENAQDRVAAAQLQASKDKFGTWEDAASVWFSGRPMKSAGNANDGYTTVPQYINKFRKNFVG